MALTDARVIGGYLELEQPLADRIAKHRRQAERYLKRLKGEAWYSQQEGEADQDEPDESYYLAQQAESVLAFYYALPFLNVRAEAAGGIVVTEWTDDGASKVEKRFASMKSINDLRREMLGQAKMLVEGDVLVEYAGVESTLVSAIDAGAAGGGFGFGAIDPGETYYDADG